MGKIITLSTLLTFLSVGVFAQKPVELRWEKDTAGFIDVIVDTKDRDQKSIDYNNLIYTGSSSNKSYTWYYNTNEAGRWETTVCDKMVCYQIGVDGKSFTNVSKNELMRFDVYAYPRADDSVCKFKVWTKIVNKGVPDSDTLLTLHEWRNKVGCGKVSTADYMKEKKVVIFPNPADDFIKIVSEAKVSEVKLTDISGKTVVQKVVNAYESSISVSHLNSGLYFVHLYNNNQRIKVLKLHKK